MEGNPQGSHRYGCEMRAQGPRTGTGRYSRRSQQFRQEHAGLIPRKEEGCRQSLRRSGEYLRSARADRSRRAVARSVCGLLVPTEGNFLSLRGNREGWKGRHAYYYRQQSWTLGAIGEVLPETSLDFLAAPP